MGSQAVTLCFREDWPQGNDHPGVIALSFPQWMNGVSSSLLSLGLHFSFPFFILLCHLFGGPYPTLCLGFTLSFVLCAQGSPLALDLELTSSRAQEL